MKTPLLRLIITALATLTASTLLTGCASSRNAELLGSFEDITAGYVKQGFKINQIRTMSVNGQLPFLDIGNIFYFKPQRGNLAAIGLSFETQDFTNSVEQIQTFASDASVDDLVELREKVILVAQAAGRVVAAEAALRGNTNTVEAVITELKDEVKDASEKLAEASKSAIHQINQKNMMIFRWQAKEDYKFSLFAGDVASAKLRKEMGRSGYVIVAGLRSRTLFLAQQDGRRLEDRDNETFKLGPAGVLTDFWPYGYGSGIYVVSHLLEAQKLAYVSEASLAKAIELHAKYSKGIKLKDIETVAMDLAISAISSLANAGVVGATSSDMVPVSIGGNGCSACRAGGHAHHGTQAHQAHEPNAGVWTPIMAVTARLRSIDDLYKKQK